jgi:RHS repeat-associated protein
VHKKIVLSLLLAFSVLPVSAQVATGLYPYGSFDNLGVDSIDRGSLNVHFSIPVVNKQGRGLGFQYQLVYDSLVWSPVSTDGTLVWTPAADWGLHGQLGEGFEGYLSYSSLTEQCPQGDGDPVEASYLSNYVYHDWFGLSHPFGYTVDNCTRTSSGQGPSSDGSGYSYNGYAVTSPNGTEIDPPVINPALAGTMTDTNGNQINNNGNGTFTDTLGTTALTITGSGTASSPRVFTYSTPTGTANVTVTYKTYSVYTNFICSVDQYNQSQDLVDRITLGDGTFYQFTYEPTPGYSGYVTGRLASLTLPQGGVISYQYTGENNGIVCADGTPQGLTRTTSTGTRTYVRSSITATTSYTAITDGLKNNVGMTFVMAGAPETFYETNRQVEQYPGNAVLFSRQTCYNNSGTFCPTTAISLPITQIDTYDTLNPGSSAGNQEHGSTFTYNSNGLMTSEVDYDFKNGSRGSPLRTETWTYPSSGIPGLLQSDYVVDGSNDLISSTSYSYDETSGAGHAALAPTSGLPQHNPESGQRGNLTTVKEFFGPGSFLSTAAAYEDTGNPLNMTGPTGESTYAYDPPTHAFRITTTPPTPSSGVSLPSSATYDPNSSLPLTAVDPNNQTVTYKSYDPLYRPTEIDYPDGGKMVASYTATQTGVYRYMTAGTHTNTQTALDGYGRLNWIGVENASGGYYWNNYCYDGNGNVQFAAYTFSSGSIVCSGAGDTYTYDALGRVLTITHADSSMITYAYNGRATQVTDENGVSRVVQVDGLGRPVAVCEISGTTLVGAPPPSSCYLDIAASGYRTTYLYVTDTSRSDALETLVAQGAQTRTFESDWLGRPTLVIQPEAGITNYSYAYSTTPGLGLTVTRVRPQANQTGTAQTTTTTQYDSIGRVVSVSYSDGTPSKGFYYDVNNYWSQTATNLKGRLAVTGGGSGSTWNGSLSSYDAMGREVNIWACGPATCGTSYEASRPLSFAYDWAGNLIQESDSVSGTIVFGRSIAGEVTSITNNSYGNLPYNPPNLVSNVVNGPDGPVSFTLGNGLNVYRSYDALGRYSGQWVCNGPAAVNCGGGTQIYGTKSQWNGSQLLAQTDTVLGQTIGYGYGDGFNRLTSLTVTAGTQQNYTYSYDLYGNRVSQTPLQGGFSFSATYSSTNNQITTSGYTYDAAGNMTNDTFHSYTYDAEGNITQVDGGGTAQYVYDVFNHRVHVQTASATTEYTYDYAGRRISSWLSPNNTGNEGRIYWGGQQLAFRSSDGTTYFDHQDTLGTERMRTDFGAGAGSSYASLPWGDGYTATINLAGADQDNGHFAGMEQDNNTSNVPMSEHAQFRQYSFAQGRWLAPDPYMGSYDLTNPQSLNRYAYALNNPLSFLDPTGLQECGGGGGGGGGGGYPGYPGDPFDPINPTPPDPPDPGDPEQPQPSPIANFSPAFKNGCKVPKPAPAPNNDPQTGVPANPCASAGGAPNPSAYAAAGTIAKVSEFLSPGGLLVNAAYLSGFRRGGALDAQPLGASRAYGNYVFGAYLSAAGIPLSVGLGGANGYAAVSNAQYPGFSMDPNYPAVPQANVANIINGYNAQRNGTLCHK